MNNVTLSIPDTAISRITTALQHIATGLVAIACAISLAGGCVASGVGS